MGDQRPAAGACLLKAGVMPGRIRAGGRRPRVPPKVRAASPGADKGAVRDLVKNCVTAM